MKRMKVSMKTRDDSRVLKDELVSYIVKRNPSYNAFLFVFLPNLIISTSIDITKFWWIIQL